MSHRREDRDDEVRGGILNWKLSKCVTSDRSTRGRSRDFKSREVIAWRQASSAVSTWKEFLCVSAIARDTCLLEVCIYELLGEFQCVDKLGNEIKKPTRRNGKRVIGVEGGYLFGGQLTAIVGERLAYKREDIEVAMSWLQRSRFTVDADVISKLRDGFLNDMHHEV